MNDNTDEEHGIGVNGFQTTYGMNRVVYLGEKQAKGSLGQKHMLSNKG